MNKKQYSPKLKFQVVLEAPSGEKTPGQIAKQYGIHPNSVGLWKKEFLERGAEVFAQDGTVQQYERRLAALEQLRGKRGRRPFGLPAVLAALELPRSTWHYHQRRKVSYTEKYRDLREPLESIARKHPEYGYRRTAVELREAYGGCVNHKVVQRLHQAWDLPLIRGTKPPKPSGIRRAITAAGDRINLVSGRETIRPFEVAYTDFTELVYANGRRKAYLMPLVDHTTKLVLGWAVGEHADTGLALQAWERARQSLLGHGVRLQGLIVHHDQDPVFTGYAWTARLLLTNHVRGSHALP